MTGNNKEEVEMFSSIISLGWACTTAASMSKYGFRSWSGPFDWIWSKNLQCVMNCMEDSFSGFLRKENLEHYGEEKGEFVDRNNGFVFIHDTEYPFESRYNDLKQKYQRRIDRFLDESTRGSCFLRTVYGVEELNYIMENSQYIRKIIKNRNPENEIVFLIRKGLKIPEGFPFLYYIMPNQHSGESHELLRSWFDDADDFLEFCASNYSAVNMMRNSAFDRKKEEKRYQSLLTSKLTLQSRYNLLLKIEDFDFSTIRIPETIFIYGAGNIGRIFYQKIKGRCSVQCFIDQKVSGEIDGIKIMRLDGVHFEERVNIIVTATYDFEKIHKEIMTYCDNAAVISLETIVSDQYSRRRS